MNVLTLLTCFILASIHTTNGFGFGIKVKDVECEELLEDPDYEGHRCTVRDLMIKRFAWNWYLLDYTELVFINATMPYIPLDLEMEMGTFELFNLSSAKLQFLDKSNFELASKLKQLYLSGNELYELPVNTFRGASALEVLDLSGSQIEKMSPDAFTGLENLKLLDLNGNLLKKFDFKELSDLVELTNLDIGYNSLTELDVADIKKHLPKLQWIGLRGSKIDCADLVVIGMKLRDFSIFTDVVDDLTGEVLPDAECVREPMGEMLFD